VRQIGNVVERGIPCDGALGARQRPDIPGRVGVIAPAQESPGTVIVVRDVEDRSALADASADEDTGAARSVELEAIRDLVAAAPHAAPYRLSGADGGLRAARRHAIPELIPHRGTKCETCGTELEVGQLLDPMCPVCGAGHPLRRPARRGTAARGGAEGAAVTISFRCDARGATLKPRGGTPVYGCIV
jgi:hypothetical protein